MTDMKTSKQVEQELEEAKVRYESLKNRKLELEKEIKKVETELSTYESRGKYFWGKIKTIENELKAIKLIEETDKLPKPVFKPRKVGNNEYLPVGEDYRISKVTLKRIYLKRINEEYLTISEEFVNKDGSGSTLLVMDIPETLKVWEEYINSKS